MLNQGMVRREKVQAKGLEERSLPHDLEAERAILGAILIHPDALVSILDTLNAQDFYRDAHRRIYAHMLELQEAGTAIDFVTVKNALMRTGQLDECGGPAYLSSLSSGIPRSTNVQHYAQIIREASHLRSTVFAANKVLSRAYEAEDPAAQVAAEGAESLFEIGGAALPGRPVLLRDLSTLGLETLEHAVQNRGQVCTGIPTGFTELDDMTAGLQPSDLVLIAARTSIGKTALAMNIGRNASQHGTTVLIFSLEMSKSQLFKRMLSSESRVDSHRMRTGFLGQDDWPKLSTAMSALAEAKILIDDTPAIGIHEVRTRARMVRAEHGLGLIIVDYLQLMRGRGRFDNRTQEVGSISRGLKAVAKEFHLPVVALAQLSRASEAGHGRKARPPRLSDLRESGDLENDADVVLLLHRPDTDPDCSDDQIGIAEVNVAKQRNGPTGTVRLAFIKQYVRFDNLAMV